jgi:GNAT superfamily N-acetyltransferase
MYFFSLSKLSRNARTIRSTIMETDLDPNSKNMIEIRRAVQGDAQQIGAVFDAAVREAWTYLGDLAREPMFPPEEWDNVVVDHAPPNALLIAVEQPGNVIGFTAVHPAENEMFLLFVHPEHAGLGVGRAHEQNKRAIAVYEAAGYRRDGFVRESDFRGVHLREPRFVKML